MFVFKYEYTKNVFQFSNSSETLLKTFFLASTVQTVVCTFDGFIEPASIELAAIGKFLVSFICIIITCTQIEKAIRIYYM